MSNLTVFFPSLQDVPVRREPLLRVEVGGRWHPLLRPVRFEQRSGAVPSVRIEMATGRLTSGTQRRLPEAALSAIAPDDLVTVDLVRTGALWSRGSGTVRLFEGTVDGPSLAYSAAGEAAGFNAVDRAAPLLARRVNGQYVPLAAGAPAWLSGVDLVFNPDGRPNMTPQAYAPAGGRTARIFAAPGAEDAEPWTAAQAAGYLLAAYVGVGWLVLPTAAELGDLFGSEVIENVRLEGLSVVEALEALCRPSGLRVTVALARLPGGGIGRTLVFVGRGLGRTISLYHQRPDETFTLARTAMEAARVELSWVDALAALHVAGDVRLYESTFELKPGWDPSLEGQDRETYRRSHSGFGAVADVYRRWVLNEAGQYSGQPVDAGDPHDFSALFGTTDLLQRRRRFLPTISTDALGESLGVLVEISTDGGAGWSRYRGAAGVLRDECGIVLSDDRLPAEVLRAAEAGQLSVRATATVESDARLAVTVERPGLGDDSRGRRRWIDAADRFRWRKVDATSVLSGGPADEVDDSQRLIQYAADLWAAQRHAPAPSRITLPFMSISYRVGDRIDGVRYRAARLARTEGGVPTDPLVEAVVARWSDEAGWQTELELI